MPPRPKSVLSGLPMPAQKPQRAEPLWQGPESKGQQGGVTFSLLSRFLTCPERFRVRVIEGLRSEEGFNHRIEYGNMWHVCEEAWAKPAPLRNAWEADLKAYAQGLANQYRLQQEQVWHWYNVCRVQFPVYVDYWSNHPDVTSRTPLLQEQVFDVPYNLPSGRTVRLRGKWDSVDLVGKGKGAGVWLQENKTKGDIDPVAMQRQLTFDLQCMMYLVALYSAATLGGVLGLPYDPPIVGVRYNVIRRPLSGGKGTIVRHKPSKSNPQGESAEAYYARLSGIIGDSPQDFFYRWNVNVTPQDVQRFRTECLDPLLERLCHWYDFVTKGKGGFGLLNWRHPFGVTNTVDEYGGTDVDAYLESGSTVGLVRADTLFRELE